eukprot:TRINITY_DN17735_c0_g1_i1.p1 TRINITY_DN17735_c0_g1~~TRINITY_DN17735_c0_g1_i1.p1  ORF type:complete len:776 (+),score=178.69 TRINITY_DN17735_c0_g1_i1:28-2328(+)
MGCAASVGDSAPQGGYAAAVEVSQGKTSSSQKMHGLCLAKCDESTSPSDRTVTGTPVAKGTALSPVLGVPLPQWPEKMLTDAGAHPWLVYKVLSFLPWSQKGSDVLRVSPKLHRFFKPREPRSQYWRWLCHCLCSEALLHLPARERDVQLLAGGDGRELDGDYRGLFKELWLLRHRFVHAPSSAGAEEESAAAELERFRVSTFCRLRPPRRMDTADGAAAFEMLSSTPVQLPLNQRVALLQQKDPKLSRAAAMKLLLNKDCGAAHPLAESAEVTAALEEVTPNKRDVPGTAGQVQEAASAPGFTASIVSVTPGPSGSVLTVSPGIGLRSWAFANVFDSSATQRDLYERCGLRLAVGLANGQSGALIVYGQTGSGKTHTMFGPPGSDDGLVTRIAHDILASMEMRRRAGFEVMLGASYVEVFGNDLTDLLGGEIGVNRGQAQRMGHKYILDGQCEEEVPDKSAFSSLLERGEARKRKASTEMNERSTRAHTLVILRLRQRAPGSEHFVQSLLSLVDLGGSEKVSKSKANENVCAPGAVNVGDEEVSRVTWKEYYRCRERITETNHINKGLLTLKRCVQALNERQRCVKEGRPLPRVPFNDSKLTMLLKPALSGESSTSVVVCAAPEEHHAEESVQSFRFGEMCSSVEHEKGGGAQDVGAAVQDALKRIDSEIKDLEAVILKKERWEWRQTTRKDVVDELDTAGVVCNKDESMELGGLGAVEIKADDGSSKKQTMEHKVWGQVLVGAEEENARREELIQMRIKLLGQD